MRLLLALCLAAPASAAEAIPTFESIGLYWTPPSNPGAGGCPVRFRPAGASGWRDGQPLWYDTRTVGGVVGGVDFRRTPECRGSLVRLQPGTTYEIELGMPVSHSLTATTWAEDFPVGKTVYVSDSASTLEITSGGTAAGYTLYTPAPGTTATISGGTYNVLVRAPYVIVRGLTLTDAAVDGVRIYE